MLKILIPSLEFYDEEKQEFFYTDECEILLEHSLMSISKWESKWKKSFLSSNEKTTEEVMDYIKCMMLNDKDHDKVNMLTPDNIKAINKYIEDPMSATVFFEDNKSNNKKETITSELIYYWMIASNIPMECQNWHLNRLLTLIRICSIKNTPPKKMSRNEIMNRNRALNQARRNKLHTNG